MTSASPPHAIAWSAFDHLAHLTQHGEDEIEAFITTLLSFIAATLQVDCVLLTRFDGDNIVVEQCVPAQHPLWHSQQRIDLGSTICHTMIEQSRTSLIVEDVQSDPRFRALQGYPVAAYTGVVVRQHDGTPYGTLCAIHDQPRQHREGEIALLEMVAQMISQRLHTKVLQEQLEEALANIAIAEEVFPAGVLVVTPRGHIVTANRGAARLIGTVPDQVEGRSLHNVVTMFHMLDGTPYDDISLILSDIAQTRTPVRDLTIGLITLSGQQKWISVNYYPLGGTSDQMMLGVADVTERVRAQLALQQANQRVSGILESMGAAFWVADTDGIITYLNREAAALMQQPAAQVMGRPIVESVSALLSSTFAEVYGRAGQTGLLTFSEFYLAASAQWFEVRIYPTAHNTTLYAHDTTAQHAMRQRLSQSEQRLDRLVERAPVALIEVDSTGIVSLANGRVAHSLGIAASQLLPADMRAGLAVALAGQSHTGTVTQGDRIFEAHWAPLHTPAPGVTGASGTLLDITEQVRMTGLAQRRARRSGLRAELSAALSSDAPLTDILTRCSDAISRSLDTAQVRIWTLEKDTNMLILSACTGILAQHTTQVRIPVGKFRVGWVAAQKQPLIDNDLLTSHATDDKMWASLQQMVAFAAYPLLTDEKVVGVISMFAAQSIAEDTQDILLMVSDVLAQGISRWNMTTLLQQSEGWHRALIENSTDMLAVINDAGETIYLSPSLRRTWEMDSHQTLLPVPLDSVLGTVHPDDIPIAQAALQSARMASEPVTTEMRALYPDGSWRYLEVILVNRLHDPHVRGIIINSREVTERKMSEIAIRQARDEAEQASQAKSAFLSRMSHELRTPLNAILGFTQLLELEDLTTPMAESVDYILKGGLHLLHLVNDVLDINMVETGRLAFSLEAIAVQDVLTTTIHLLTPLAQSHAVTFNIQHGVVTTAVLANEQRLQQVLVNILSNAIKYNRPNGTVTVSVVSAPDERISIAIRDTGQGIAEEKLGRLFTPFDRLGAEQTQIEGTGLGMVIVKTLVEAMQGTLTVRSTAGEGTEVMVMLPAAIPSPESPMPPPGTDRYSC